MVQTDYIHVPYGKTVYGEEEIDAVVKVLRTSTQMGKHVREMEERVAGFTIRNMALWSTAALQPFTLLPIF